MFQGDVPIVWMLFQEHLIALRSGSVVANEVYPRHDYC